MYAIDAEEVQALRILYIQTGLGLPSTAGPWSSDELAKLLNRVDKAALPKSLQSLYERLEASFSYQPPSFQIGLDLTLESYLHSNTDDFTTSMDWFVGYQKRKPMVAIPMKLSLAGLFHAQAELAMQRNPYATITPPVTGSSPYYGTSSASTNLVVLDGTSLDGNIPYFGYAALTGDGWTAQMGRSKVSWGPGITGNFMVGSHLQYHSMARFTAYSDAFKFSFITSFFPHPDEIWDVDQDNLLDTDPLDTDAPGYTQSRPLVGLKMFMGYRLEWRLAKDKLGLAINEGIMYQSDIGTLDLRVFNPFTVYHNYYILNNANSLLSLELDYTPMRGLNFYLQFALDEFAIGAETSGSSGVHPNALGWMVGAKSVRPTENGYLYLNAEGVYTDPYLYIRSLDGDTAPQQHEWETLDYVVSIRRWINNSIIYDQTYLGYQYGGDAIVGSLDFGYKSLDAYSLSARLFYMAHGEKNTETFWKLDDPSTSPTGLVTHSVDLGISFSKQFGKWSLASHLDMMAKIIEYVPTYDVQLALSASYSV